MITEKCQKLTREPVPGDKKQCLPYFLIKYTYFPALPSIGNLLKPEQDILKSSLTP